MHGRLHPVDERVEVALVAAEARQLHADGFVPGSCTYNDNTFRDGRVSYPKNTYTDECISYQHK
jgi:hypothetical protein